MEDKDSARRRWERRVRAAELRRECKERKAGASKKDSSSNGASTHYRINGGRSLDWRNNASSTWDLPSMYYHLAALLYEVEELKLLMQIADGYDEELTYRHISYKMKGTLNHDRLESLMKSMENLSTHQYLLICSFLYRAMEVVTEEPPDVCPSDQGSS